MSIVPFDTTQTMDEIERLPCKMANSEEVLKSVQDCLEYITQKGCSSLSIMKYIQDIHNKLITTEQPDECYVFFAANVVQLWNATLNESGYRNDVHILNVIFTTIAFISREKQFTDTSMNIDYLYEGIHWLQFKGKIALKYSQLLLVNHDYLKAENALQFAITQNNLLITKINSQTNDIGNFSTEASCLVEECEEDLLICEVYRIETHATLGNYEQAQVLLENLQDINNQKVGNYLAALCYNIGLELYKKQLFKESTYWLQRSVKFEQLRNTLLLLAEVYLSWNGKSYYKDALNAINLIDDRENKNWDCNYLNLRSLIIGEAPLEDLEPIISQIWEETDLTETKGLQILLVMLKCRYKNVIYNTLQNLENKLDSIRKGDKIFENHLLLLIKDGLLSNAEKLIKSFILSFQDDGTTGAKCQEQLLSIVECEAQTLKEKQKYMKAIVWFDYCIELINCFKKRAENGRNAIKFFHQKCSCLLELGWYDEAQQVLCLAETCLQNHPLNWYFKLKLCILQDKEQEIYKILELFNDRLKSAENVENTKILMTCEQLATKNLKYHMAISILQVLAANSAACSTNILKQLLKLKLLLQCDFTSKSEHEWLLDYSSKVCHYFQTSTEERSSILVETKWFVKMLWNIAHLNKDNPSLIHKIMRFCNIILKTSDDKNVVILLQRITCLMLSVTSGLETGRYNSSTDILENVTNDIEELKYLYSVAYCEIASDHLPVAFRSTERLLLLCEFEVKAKLKAPGLQDLFESIITLHDADTNFFEILAAIAFANNSDHYYSFTLRSLKAAIARSLEQNIPDYDHISRLYHSMLRIILLKMENDRSFENDFGRILSEIRDIFILKQVKTFPQTELLWFVTKGWNVSVKVFHQYGKDCDALNWAKTTIELADQLVSLRSFYQEKMNKFYAQLLHYTTERTNTMKSLN